MPDMAATCSRAVSGLVLHSHGIADREPYIVKVDVDGRTLDPEAHVDQATRIPACEQHLDIGCKEPEYAEALQSVWNGDEVPQDWVHLLVKLVHEDPDQAVQPPMAGEVKATPAKLDEHCEDLACRFPGREAVLETVRNQPNLLRSVPAELRTDIEFLAAAARFNAAVLMYAPLNLAAKVQAML